MKPFTHCSFCGTLFPHGDTWPKTCVGCQRSTWRNPTPVAVLLQPVWFPHGDAKLVGIRRQNTVQSGMISPPGGFVTLGETWQEAATREAKEEANIDVDPNTIAVFDIVSASEGVILIFGIAPFVDAAQLCPFIPNHEASERVLIARGDPLAFPLHEIIANRYLDRMYRKKQREDRANKRFLEELYGDDSVNCGEEGAT